MSISQCILLQLLARPPLLWQEHAWVPAASKYQRSEPSFHFLIYAKTDMNNLVLCQSSGQCQGALGISDGSIKNTQLFASSSADETQQPFHARINKTIKGSKGGWCSAFPDNTEFIEVDLLKPFLISGSYVHVRGGSTVGEWAGGTHPHLVVSSPPPRSPARP
jgi:hypothetical protein